MTTWRVHGLLLALLVLLGAGVLVYETWWNDFSSLNHYEALGVHERASLRDVKRAFRERSLQYHPDKASLSIGTADLNTRRFHRIWSARRVRPGAAGISALSSDAAAELAREAHAHNARLAERSPVLPDRVPVHTGDTGAPRDGRAALRDVPRLLGLRHLCVRSCRSSRVESVGRDALIVSAVHCE